MQPNLCILSESLPPNLGGAGTVVKDQSKYLKETFKITIITKSLIELNNLPDYKDLTIISISTNIRILFMFYCLYICIFKNHNAFHIINGHGIIFAPVLFILKFLSKSKIILTIHGIWSYIPYESQLGRLASHLEQIFIKIPVDLIISVDPYVQKNLSRFHKKVEYIPNGIDIFHEKNWPDKYGHQEQILFIGRLEIIKKIDVLLDAFHEIQKANSSLKLVIVGSGTLETEIRTKIHSYPSRHKINLLGRLTQKEIEKEIKKSLMLVLPSGWEAFPIVALEAMALKLPVILTNNTGIKSLFHHNVDLLYFRTNDVNDLILKIQYIILHPMKCKQLTTNAFNKIKQSYTLAKTSKQLQSVLLKFLVSP